MKRALTRFLCVARVVEMLALAPSITLALVLIYAIARDAFQPGRHLESALIQHAVLLMLTGVVVFCVLRLLSSILEWLLHDDDGGEQ